MTYPLLQFVSAPEVGATVRFDFNAALGVDSTSFYDHEGFSLGAPEMIGNPGEYGTSWGDRELTLTAFIEGSRSAALAAQTTLARELWRAENWLAFQLDANSPRFWFKTYRSAPGALSFEHVYNDRDTDLWGIPVTLTAEGGAYGPRETIGPVTIANNPSSGTNRMSYVLPTIKGDVPAPLRVEATMQAYYQRIMLATTALDSTSSIAGPSVYDIGSSDAWTASTDTSAGVADSTYAGGSYRSVSFATQAGMSGRLFRTITIPSPGSWRALVRVGSSDGSSTYSLQLTNGGEVATPPTTLGQSGPLATWVDLGVIPLPGNVRDREASPMNLTLTISAARTSGTGSLRLDSLMLVPIDTRATVETRSLFTYLTGSGSASIQKHRWDADEEYYQFYLDGLTATYDAVDNEGHFLTVSPGAKNIFYYVQQVSPEVIYDANSDSISDTASVTLSYHPRYLWIGA